MKLMLFSKSRAIYLLLIKQVQLIQYKDSLGWKG